LTTLSRYCILYSYVCRHILFVLCCIVTRLPIIVSYRSGHRLPYTGQRLRSFFDELFMKGGYMIMHKRHTLQARNTDLLLVKVFCVPY